MKTLATTLLLLEFALSAYAQTPALPCPIHVFGERVLPSVPGVISQLDAATSKMSSSPESADIEVEKLARYELAFQDPLATYWNPLHHNDATAIAQILADDKFKAGAFGVELPIDFLNKMGHSQLKGGLSPAAVKRVVSFYNAREALQGYQRVLSGSGRSSDKVMQLNLDALPSPIDPDNYAKESLGQFKENIHIAGQGLPILPGVKTPEEMEQQVKQAR